VFLLSEHGDLYKVTLDQNGNDVLGIVVQYLQTIVPCAQLNLLESGYLFAAGDCTNHYLYKFLDLGGGEEKPILSNSTIEFDEDDVVHNHDQLVRFCPRTDNINL